jgi:glucose/arabinose dehydrogenase
MTDRRSRHRRLAALASLAALLLLTIIPASVARGATEVSINLRASGLQALTQVTNADDGTNRLFLVEKRGTVRVYQNGAVKSGFFLNIASIVDDAAGERGLLGLAFHPDFETNRLLYVYYTRSGGDIVVARMKANSAGTSVSTTTRQSLLVIEHSRFSNHNGGALAFGPDGYLYIGTGDGGGAGDPLRNAQNKSRLLGKILRIDVDKTGSGPYDRYGIPSTNPFRGATPGLAEVWAYGLRNPWRISFDRTTGYLYIADVGQSRYEEVNREPPNYRGGRNYGWNVMEGKHCYNASSCNTTGKFKPVVEYTHASGNCSVTGGYVYRGAAYPGLRGLYMLADFCSGKIWTMPAAGSSLWLRRDTTLMLTSFGESENGELYGVTINGRLYQFGTK